MSALPQNVNAVEAPQMETPESWSSPTDHFRPRHKFLTWYTDKEYNVTKWLNFKDACLNKFYVPWFTPVYFFATHFSQRNRNLFLVENNLTYRPYKFRRNDEDGNKY